ncbi:MAG: cell division protein ZapA [Acidobacteriota bacterium]
MEQTTAVTIFNQTYQVRSARDPEVVRQLAQHVDQRMLELSRRTPSVDTLKIAVLAALLISDEYFATERKLNSLERTISDKTQAMVGMLKPLMGCDSP